ncbi:hypothetical protein ACFU99_12385 [Streptomyces sp. NPDC057654]|uniref:hypothetical protein n=1 Tax=Streptomyces sp. NPDC057654 TaxID=3346196 RepID=UPI0036CF5B20
MTDATSTTPAPAAPGTPENRRGAIRLVILLVIGLVLVIAACLGLQRWWEGEPYPEADPRAVVGRLQDSARSSYELLSRPEVDGLGWRNVDTGPCYYRGMQYLSHFDQPDEDVKSFHTGWATEKPVARADAVTAVARLRERLKADGWSVSSERSDRNSLELRLIHPDTADYFTAEWYGARSHSPLRIATGTECVRMTTAWKPDAES